MTSTVLTNGVAASTESLRHMIKNPWSYFPNLVGGDLVGLGQVGPNRFLVAFGRTWSSGTPSQTDPPTFANPVAGGPRVFDVSTSSRLATEITPSLLLAPNASLRAAVMAGTGMHLIASTNSGTQAQFIQHFASTTIRALDSKPLSPSVWSNGVKHAVEWDRGAAPDAEGFFAIGADAENSLYASRVRTALSGVRGYDPSRRSYLSDKGWTSLATEQTPLRRSNGDIITSTVPVGLVHRRQWWYMLLPKQQGASWGWELLRASSLLSRFSHVQDIPGQAAGPICARFLPGIVLDTDPTRTPGVGWCTSTEKSGSFVPSLGQLQI